MDVDTIVIGSGAGGLTAALGLARTGDKVLVLEQHDVAGGWCHSFQLEGHVFSPGVHYIGALGPGGKLRRIYEGLGVSKDLVFLELNPDGVDHVIIGKERFDIPKGKDALADRLAARFPEEAVGIRGYLDLVEKIATELDNKMGGGLLGLPFRAPTLVRYGLQSTDSVLDRFVKDPLLRAILTIQAGDHGLGPKDAPFAVHASVQAHYFDGGWYPRGGGVALPRAFVARLREHGGELRLKATVDKILVEGGKAIGVRLVDGEEIRAKHVISNADPGIAFGKLVDPEHVPWRLRRKLANSRWSISSLSMFLAANLDADALGLDSGNYWFSQDANIQKGYDLATADTLDLDEFPGQFLTVTTRKDRTKGKGELQTMESFVFVSDQVFKKWATSKFGDRPQDYAALKEYLSVRMLRTANRIIPGLKDRVVFRDLGTPLTNQHYCMATRGNLYGTEKSRFQVGPFAWSLKTPIAGLWTCGASTLSHGVMGATLSGLVVAAKIKGVRTEDLLDAHGPELRCYPCDDPSAWPEAMQAKLPERRSA